MIKCLTLFSSPLCLAMTVLFTFGCGIDNSGINLPDVDVGKGYYESIMHVNGTTDKPQMLILHNGRQVADGSDFTEIFKVKAMPKDYKIYDEKEFKIYNLGNEILFLSGFPIIQIDVSGSFSISRQPSITYVLPGENTSFIVRFYTMDEGHEVNNIKIIIPSNAGNISFFVHGIGEAGDTTGLDVKPFAPSEVSVWRNYSNPSSIRLTWADNSEIESGFKIFKKTSYSGDFEEIATKGQDRTEFYDYADPTAEINWYRVCAYTDTQQSNYEMAKVYSSADPLFHFIYDASFLYDTNAFYEN